MVNLQLTNLTFKHYPRVSPTMHRDPPTTRLNFDISSCVGSSNAINHLPLSMDAPLQSILKMLYGKVETPSQTTILWDVKEIHGISKVHIGTYLQVCFLSQPLPPSSTNLTFQVEEVPRSYTCGLLGSMAGLHPISFPSLRWSFTLFMKANSNISSCKLSNLSLFYST